MLANLPRHLLQAYRIVPVDAVDKGLPEQLRAIGIARGRWTEERRVTIGDTEVGELDDR